MKELTDENTNAHQSPVPQVLYKYRCWDENHREHKRILTHNEIFFASPRHFNDPFDCRIPLHFLDAPKIQLRESRVANLKRRRPDLNRRQRREKAMLDVRRLRRKAGDPAAREKDESDYIERVFANFGVFSLSKNSENLLLWSHYADSHTGFCVGINVEKLRATADKLFTPNIRTNLFPVEYAADYPRVVPYTRKFGHPTEALDRTLTVKASDWSYEEEWRQIIMYATDRALILPDDAITKVVLGSEMGEKAVEEIKSVLRNKSTPIELAKATIKKDKFGLDFEEVPLHSQTGS